MIASSLLLASTVSLFLSSAAALSSNLPFLPSVPAHAVNLAIDEDSNVIIAYNASGHAIGKLAPEQHQALLPRDDPGTCFTVDADDIQQLPGWGAVKDYITNEWGGDWDTIEVNPPDYPDSPMELCSLAPVTDIVLDGEPQCMTKKQSLGGTTENVHAQLKLTSNQNSLSKTSVTVTQESVISVGSSVSVKMGLPGIGGLEASISDTFSMMNSLSTANDFTVTGKSGQTATMPANPGDRCLLTLDVTHCTAQGYGSQKMTASGFVWISYGHKVKDHYKWATKIDDHLSEDDRSVGIQFRTTTSTVSRSDYTASCEPINPPASDPPVNEPPVTETPPADTPTDAPPAEIPTDSPPAETPTSTEPPATETPPPADPPVSETPTEPTPPPAEPSACVTQAAETVTVTETVNLVGTVTLQITVTAPPAEATPPPPVAAPGPVAPVA